jgi:hypothetical protein
MADLSITAANVVSTGSKNQGVAGASITQGQCVYLDSTTNTIKLADADAVASTRNVGVALNAAATGQPVIYHIAGTITIGATVAVGTAYYVSATAGGICLESDLSSGDFPTFIGFGTTTTTIFFSPQVCGVAKA